MEPTQFNSTNQSLPAVAGSNTAGGTGVVGLGHTGVFGESPDFVGVSGMSHDPHNAGVMGVNDKGGWGVTGRSEHVGVSGESTAGNGVEGHSVAGRGVMGVSQNDVGVHGKGGLLAGLFEGGVKITGELYVQGNVRLPAGSDMVVEHQRPVVRGEGWGSPCRLP